MALLDYLRDFVEGKARKALRYVGESFIEDITHVVHRATHNLMRQVMTMLIIAFALSLLAIAVVFFFIEYLVLTKTLAFLITGILVLFIGLVMKLKR